jgi:uncharacterized protein with ParB-like and HNH nuclease domain
MDKNKTDLGYAAEAVALETLLKKRYLTVPDYQRGFAWEKKQLEHFYDYLIAPENYNPDVPGAFCGTFMLLDLGGTEKKEREVVDGQ